MRQKLFKLIGFRWLSYIVQAHPTHPHKTSATQTWRIGWSKRITHLARKGCGDRIIFIARPSDCAFSIPASSDESSLRIRFGPLKTSLQALVEGFLVFYALFTPLSLLIITSPDTPKVNKIVSSAKIRTIRL